MNRRDVAFLAGPVQATGGRSARSGARVEEGQRGRGDGSPRGHAGALPPSPGDWAPYTHLQESGAPPPVPRSLAS